MIVSGPGASPQLLAQALRGAGEVLATRLIVLAPGETPGALTGAMAGARLVFVAADPSEPEPPELAQLAPGQWIRVNLDSLLADPRSELIPVCEFAGIRYDQRLLTPLENARRRELEKHAELQTLTAGAAASPFASVSTTSFASAIRATGGSLLISTYQTHRLVCVRAKGDELNTHFRVYEKPMGIAVAPGRIALGTRTEVWDFRDVPAVTSRLDPPGAHDACYVPRNRHVTGEIAIHDIAFADGELWMVNTAFSCLATLDAEHSFVPRWKPSFITALVPEDRCHLNGMAVRDGRVAHVTAFSTTDEAGGWRPHKASGGVVIDVASSEVAIAGLSMPHSPRWHQGQLWLLESGRGTLAVADLDSGTVETVCELPGFTRGLTLVDGIAFIGLSQIRETATFGDLPLTERLSERQSGVWMVDTRSGQLVGFLRFEDLVQEIFDVVLLPGTSFPEIAEPAGSITDHTYVMP
jgi:uncharacterized protein (TIGR03032 family)